MKCDPSVWRKNDAEGLESTTAAGPCSLSLSLNREIQRDPDATLVAHPSSSETRNLSEYGHDFISRGFIDHDRLCQIHVGIEFTTVDEFNCCLDAGVRRARTSSHHSLKSGKHGRLHGERLGDLLAVVDTYAGRLREPCSLRSCNGRALLQD